MKTITYCIAIVMWVLALASSQAQEVSLKQQAIEQLEAKKEEIINAEKNALRQEVEVINSRLEKDEITLVEAENIKNDAAEKHALNIENKIAIIDNQMALLERNGEIDLNTIPGKITIGLGDEDHDGDFIFGVKINDGKQRTRRYDRRTSSDLVFSFGLNNTSIDGQSLSDSPYKVAGSRYAEIGFAWKTRVFKESNWLRLKYGLSFQFNGLKPTDNRYFVDTGSTTELQTFPLDLDKSKLRMDNLVIPIHFEIGPSRKIEKDSYFRYDTNRSFKLGIGGYAGLNIGTRQKLKFTEDNEDIKQKLKANYNTNAFVYGVSGYIGWADISLYAKYDLNTLFKDNPIEQRNVSLGVRWDWD